MKVINKKDLKNKNNKRNSVKIKFNGKIIDFICESEEFMKGFIELNPDRLVKRSK